MNMMLCEAKCAKKQNPDACLDEKDSGFTGIFRARSVVCATKMGTMWFHPARATSKESMSDLLSYAARGLTQASWVVWLIYFVVMTQATITTVTLYLHRSQAHRGVEFHPAVAHLFRFWCWLTTAW